MLSASYDFQESELYKHDLVDITRQYLQNKIETLYTELLNAFQNKSAEQFINKSIVFLEAMEDMDKILGTSSNFLLGTWLRQAKDMAHTPVEAQLFEINAGNQITIWGQILDYAMKQWSGIIQDFCLPRWKLFFDTCLVSLANGRNFNTNKFRARVLKDVEEPFIVDSKIYPINGVGDTFATSKELYLKWTNTTNQNRF